MGVIMAQYLYKDLDDDTILWRYMSLVKFLDILATQKLNLCRLDGFEDKLEGSNDKLLSQIHARTKNNIFGASYIDTVRRNYEIAKIKSYALCMHANNYESAAMWKLYGNHGETIAIKTTVGKLKSSFVVDSQKLHFGAVVYEITEQEIKAIHDSYAQNTQSIPISPLDPLFLKRASFKHENEYRVIYSDVSNSFTSMPPLESVDNLKKSQRLIHKVDCDVNELIGEILIYPEAPTWVVNAINETIKKFGYNFCAKKSTLYDLM